RRRGGHLARRDASVELVATFGGRDQRAVEHSGRRFDRDELGGTMMTDGQESRRSWARLAPSGTALVLFCSLFLNVALGSYVAVQALVAQPQRPPQRGPQQMVARLAERLSPSDAAILREAYLAREAEILAAEMAGQRARARITEILGRPELDVDAMRAASKDM